MWSHAPTVESRRWCASLHTYDSDLTVVHQGEGSEQLDGDPRPRKYKVLSGQSASITNLELKMANKTPSIKWRDRILEGVYFPKRFFPELPEGPERYTRLLRDCESWYRKAQSISPTATQSISPDSESIRAIGFVAAIALLTYGRIDVLDDALDLLPTKAGGVQVLAEALKTLLPLPRELDARINRDAVRDWICHHKQQLVWVEEDGVYILADQ